MSRKDKSKTQKEETPAVVEPIEPPPSEPPEPEPPEAEVPEVEASETEVAEEAEEVKPEAPIMVAVGSVGLGKYFELKGVLYRVTNMNDNQVVGWYGPDYFQDKAFDKNTLVTPK